MIFLSGCRTVSNGSSLLIMSPSSKRFHDNCSLVYDIFAVSGVGATLFLVVGEKMHYGGRNVVARRGVCSIELRWILKIPHDTKYLNPWELWCHRYAKVMQGFEYQQ